MATIVERRVEPSLLTVGDAAALLHVHTNTVRRWEAHGLIQAWRVGPRHDRRFLRSDVERLLESARATNGSFRPVIEIDSRQETV